MYNIIEACRYRGVKKVVFASSVATYGNPEVDEVDETTPFYWQTTPPALALYAASKIIGENLLRLYQQWYGLDYVALRYATVYGERQHHRGVNALHIIASYERVKAGQPPILPGDGSEGHDYIYVGDVARATVMAMASEVSGESFVIATGINTSLNGIAQILLRLTGSSLQPVYQEEPGTVAPPPRPRGLSAHQGQAAVGVGGASRDRGRHPPADGLGRRSQHAVDGPVPYRPRRQGRQGWSSVSRHTWHRGTPKIDKLVVSLGNVYGREPLSVVHHGKLDSLWIHCLVDSHEVVLDKRPHAMKGHPLSAHARSEQKILGVKSATARKPRPTLVRENNSANAATMMPATMPAVMSSWLTGMPTWSASQPMGSSWMPKSRRRTSTPQASCAVPSITKAKPIVAISNVCSC